MKNEEASKKLFDELLRAFLAVRGKIKAFTSSL